MKVLRNLLIVTGMLLAVAAGVFAQTGTTALTDGEIVDGQFTANGSASAVYTYRTTSDTMLNIALSSESDLLLLVTSTSGDILGQASTEDGLAQIGNVDVAAGSYLITVVNQARGTAAAYQIAAGPDLVVFEVPAEVTLTPAAGATAEATVPAVAPLLTYETSESISLANGIQVQLSWNAPVDLNMEVRDPLGGSLYFDNRSTDLGEFGADANGLCEIISDAPAEQATYRPGFLPTGSYEILIFYRQACDTPVAVPFTLDVAVEGEALQTVSGIITPPTGTQDSVYLANFVVTPDASAVLNEGGAYPDSSLNILPAPSAEIIAAAQPVTIGAPLTGSILEEQDYLSYSYTTTEDQTIGVSLQAIAGNLDTLLQVMAADGSLINVNDDVNNDTTDSQIGSLRISAGTYYIIASRYGKEIGGTEGQFQLSIGEPSNVLPQQILDFNLPQGDIEVTMFWNTQADVQLLVRDPRGDAVFDDDPDIPSGGTLFANGNVNCTIAETATPYSYIYWPTGFLNAGVYEVEVWYQNGCGDTRPVEFTLVIEVDGVVERVEVQRPALNQRFVVSFLINPDRTVSVGQGGYIGSGSSLLNYQAEVGTAPVIQSGQSLSGALSLTNAFDVYQFEGTAGQLASVSMQATSQTLDTNVFLVSPSGVEIASSDDADPSLLGTTGRTTDSFINAAPLPEDGTYYIIATRFATLYGGTIGGYSITLTLNNP